MWASEGSHPDINILDKMSKNFAAFRNILDSEYHYLHTKCIGATVKHCEVLTPADEAQLWTSQAIGIHSPLALLRAVFILNGKNFCLRGGNEQFKLKLTQIQKGFNPELQKAYYIYTDNNRRGFDLHPKNKSVKQYAQPEMGCACHVYLLDLYLSMIPIGAEQFYPKPLSPQTFVDEWFSTDPCPRNFLKVC